MNANNGWFDSDFSSSDAGAFGTSAGGDGFFDDGSSAPQKQQRNGGGGLHIPLALLSLLLTAGASFGMAWLTRDIPQRGALLLGCTFALPALTVMLTALVLEKMNSAMTPSYSRKGQLGVAAVTVLVCFIIGCFGEVVSGFSMYKPVEATPTPTPAPTPTPYVAPPQYNYILLLDKSSSMLGSYNAECVNAVNAFLEDTADDVYVGVVAFSDEIIGSSNPAPLGNRKDADLQSVIRQTPRGLTDFVLPIQEALQMISDTDLPADRATRVILVTDGSSDIEDETAETFIQLFHDNNASLSCLQITTYTTPAVEKMVKETGGMLLEVKDVDKLHETLLLASQSEPTPSPTPTLAPTPTPEPIIVKDVLREVSSHSRSESWRSSLWTSAIMLVAEGLAIGVALTLMLSRRGQRRFQPALSVLMGVAAVLLLILPETGTWLNEAAAFCCFGLVLMKKNR